MGKKAGLKIFLEISRIPSQGNSKIPLLRRVDSGILNFSHDTPLVISCGCLEPLSVTRESLTLLPVSGIQRQLNGAYSDSCSKSQDGGRCLMIGAPNRVPQLQLPSTQVCYEVAAGASGPIVA
jgi:hypothetical protein